MGEYGVVRERSFIAPSSAVQKWENFCCGFSFMSLVRRAERSDHVSYDQLRMDSMVYLQLEKNQMVGRG